MGEMSPRVDYTANKALKDATKMMSAIKEDVRHGFRENVMVNYIL